ncbi:DNA excision repair protein ERCC-1 [Heracleum sosnowskyi]|uniref:DNA excision repair protein ERCC-1 n=1 Tax=Heracleum sosnowskyi TaxID=360622 RepID=A0AAD8JFM8_9APIA|nr:DNA excision repair protein ERCC-1 [Heracleum sosnowskyi]
MEDENRHETPNNKPFVIEIPSYEQVIQGSAINSQPKTTPSLSKPSSSFSQAFNFIKKSDLYSPPPPPAPFTPASSSGGINVEAPGAASAYVRPHGNSRNAILVSHRQKGNPLLKHIRNVRWEFADIVCDYLLGQETCALYLSVRYHLLHPDYLYFRIRELQKKFKLRVVLCHVDIEDVVKPLLEITKTSMLHDCTLLCGWSLEECGRYLETIKVYQHKSADIIQGQMDTDYMSRLNHALTSIRHVNKTDVVTLGSTFGSLAHIMDASMEDLGRCPGIGERKVKRLYETFHEPFKRVVSHKTTILGTPTETAPVLEGNVDEKDTEDASKRKKKEPELTVKSALSEAFMKYSGKVGAKNNKATA